jgi:hypothetical protein
MKVPFITGGENCKHGCNGSGRLAYYVKLFNGERSTVLGQCPCVEAHEATIETFRVGLQTVRNIRAGRDEEVPVMVHKVMPLDA